MNKKVSPNTTNDTRKDFYRKQRRKARSYSVKSQWGRMMALFNFGLGLHALQDIFAHWSVTTMKEHNSYKYNGKSIIDDPDYDINFKTGKVSKPKVRTANPRYLKTDAITEKAIRRLTKIVPPK